MESIGLNISFGKERVIFHLQIITAAEENRLRQRFIGLTEKEKEEKAFELNAAILSDYQAEKAEIVTLGENGEEIKTPIETKDYFKSKTAIKDRIAEYAVHFFLISLQPSIDFL